MNPPKPLVDQPEPEGERELILAAQRGDEDAIRELVRLHYGKVLGFLAAQVSTKEDAKDLAQEVFSKAFLKISSMDSDGSFGAWLMGFARNYLRNYWRKGVAQPVGGNEELELLLRKENSQGKAAGDCDVFIYLEECRWELTSDHRELLERHYNIGESVTEIARGFGVRHSTISMRFQRLRRLLRHCIQGKMGREVES